MGWSAVCDCGISWSYSLTFWYLQEKAILQILTLSVFQLIVATRICLVALMCLLQLTAKTNNVEICKNAFTANPEIWGSFKKLTTFSWASEPTFIIKFKHQKSRRIILAKNIRKITFWVLMPVLSQNNYFGICHPSKIELRYRKSPLNGSNWHQQLHITIHNG